MASENLDEQMKLNKYVMSVCAKWHHDDFSSNKITSQTTTNNLKFGFFRY